MFFRIFPASLSSLMPLHRLKQPSVCEVHVNSCVLTDSVFEQCVSCYYIFASRRRRKTYIGHVHLCVCVSVCQSVRIHMPTLLPRPGCNLEEW